MPLCPRGAVAANVPDVDLTADLTEQHVADLGLAVLRTFVVAVHARARSEYQAGQVEAQKAIDFEGKHAQLQLEIDSNKTATDAQLQKLTAEIAAAQEAANQSTTGLTKLTADHQAEITALKGQHVAELNAASTKHTTEVNDLTTKHHETTNGLRDRVAELERSLRGLVPQTPVRWPYYIGVPILFLRSEYPL